MNPWLQRILTVAAGVGVGMLGIAFPAAAPFTTPAAAGLVTWAIRHPADKRPPRSEDEP